MNHKQRHTLHALFAHPVSSNIDPRLAFSLIETLGGEVTHGGRGHILARLNGHTHGFHDPHHALSKDVFGADPRKVIYIGDKKVGEFMKKKVFEPGRTLNWKGLTKHATGEELNPKAFAKDFEG